MQRFNTKMVFDHEHKEQPDKENLEESEGLMTSFDFKATDDLYEQLEQEQMIEDKDKEPSEDPGSNLPVLYLTEFHFVSFSFMRDKCKWYLLSLQFHLGTLRSEPMLLAFEIYLSTSDPAFCQDCSTL